MASGKFDMTVPESGFKSYLEWKSVANASANNSKVTGSLYVTRTSSGTTYGNGTFTMNVGGYVKTDEKYYTIPYGSYVRVVTHEVTIPHDINGTKKTGIRAFGHIPNVFSVMPTGENVRFDPIDRRSTFTFNASSINAGSAITVSISRKSSSFTHTVTYNLGSRTYTASNVSTSHSYTIPTAWIAENPNHASRTCTVTVQTKHGSTNIGSAISKNFTVNVPSSIVPSISSFTFDGLHPLGEGEGQVFVQKKAAGVLNVTAAGHSGSTIKSYAITHKAGSTSVATYTTQSPTTAAFAHSGVQTFTAVATDSRGRTASKTVTSPMILPYIDPMVSALNCHREATSPSTVHVQAAGSFASYGGQNEGELTIRVGNTSQRRTLTLSPLEEISTYDEAFTFEGIDTDSTMNVRATVRDAYGSGERNALLPTMAVTMDFHESGKGIAIGKVAEEEGLDINWPVTMRSDLHIKRVDNGYTRIYKNHSPAADFGLQLSDYNSAGEESYLRVRAGYPLQYNNVGDGNGAQNVLTHLNAHSHVYTLQNKTLIPRSSDLNKYTTVGSYYVEGNASAQTIANRPHAQHAFALIVDSPIGSDYYLVQTCITNSAHVYLRYTTTRGAVWNAWKQVQMV